MFPSVNPSKVDLGVVELCRKAFLKFKRVKSSKSETKNGKQFLRFWKVYY